MNKRSKGAEYELAAAKYLKTCGYRILQMNYRCPRGEIDLVAEENEYLVFVEVKYRKNKGCGEGEYAVDRRKQRRISAAALWYLTVHAGRKEIPCRFDVVAVEGSRFHLIRDAFPFSVR